MFKNKSPEIAIAIFSITAVAFQFVVVSIWPSSYDNKYLGDTLYFLTMGKRSLEGLWPGTDYENFYGQLTAAILFLAFKVEGLQTKSIDLALVLCFCIAASLLALTSRQRLKFWEASALLAIFSSTMFCYDPIEDSLIAGHSVTRAYFYDHLGACLMIALSVFTLLPSHSDKKETLSAVVAGVTAFLLIEVKPVFAEFLLFIFVAMLLRHTKRTVFVAVSSMLLTAAIFDPMLRTFSKTLIYELEITSRESGGVYAIIIKAISSLLNEGVLVGLSIVTIVSPMFQMGPGRFKVPLASILICVGYTGAAVTMGWVANAQLVPFCNSIILIGMAQLRDLRGANFIVVRVMFAVSLSLFVVPACVSVGRTHAFALQRTTSSMVDFGPLNGYVFDGNIVRAAFSATKSVSSADTHAAAEKGIQITKSYFIAGGLRNTERDSTFFVYLDGALALKEINGIAQRIVIAPDPDFNFEAALTSKPSADFPIWASTSALRQYNTTGKPLDADIVMLLRKPFSEYLGIHQAPIVSRLNSEFVPCRTTTFWVIYMRRSLTDATCTN